MDESVTVSKILLTSKILVTSKIFFTSKIFVDENDTVSKDITFPQTTFVASRLSVECETPLIFHFLTFGAALQNSLHVCNRAEHS